MELAWVELARSHVQTPGVPFPHVSCVRLAGSALACFGGYVVRMHEWCGTGSDCPLHSWQIYCFKLCARRSIHVPSPLVITFACHWYEPISISVSVGLGIVRVDIKTLLAWCESCVVLY